MKIFLVVDSYTYPQDYCRGITSPCQRSRADEQSHDSLHDAASFLLTRYEKIVGNLDDVVVGTRKEDFAIEHCNERTSTPVGDVSVDVLGR